MSTAPRARLLIVDDELAQMSALCDTLRAHGYATTGFTRGEEALPALGATKFDVLLTDLMMPGLDGVALLTRALKIDPELVGILMTGEGTIATAVEAMQAGALDYVLKPLKLSAILPVLARAVDVRRLRLENAALHERVRERAQALEASNQELESFSYAVSHDLRAPLRAIDGFSRRLLEDHAPGLDGEAQRLLETVRANTLRMGWLIDDLLAFSRLGHVPVTRRPADMEAIVSGVFSELAAAEADRGRLELRLGELPAAAADPDLMRQVWVNLLSNAVKYTRPRPRALVEVTGERRADRLFYRVRDNGVGFDMGHVEKLFTVFQRLHSAHDFEGTGAGLAIVKRIVTRHGGDVFAEGREGEGSTFGFWVPAEGSGG